VAARFSTETRRFSKERISRRASVTLLSLPMRCSISSSLCCTGSTVSSGPGSCSICDDALWVSLCNCHERYIIVWYRGGVFLLLHASRDASSSSVSTCLVYLCVHIHICAYVVLCQQIHNSSNIHIRKPSKTFSCLECELVSTCQQQ
jgi:hypothetical protein